MARRAKTPRYYYNQQKQNATRRGIPWEFTLETWWAVWRASEKWHLGGPKRGEYCMSRFGDAGTYNPCNVEIRESSVNAYEAMKDWPTKKRAREAALVQVQPNPNDSVRLSPRKTRIVVVPEKKIEKVWSWKSVIISVFFDFGRTKVWLRVAR
jgi:hypothetical protein